MKKTQKSPKPGESWTGMLSARMVPNQAAKASAPDSEGCLAITIPARRPAWAVFPITLLVRPPLHKTLQLDRLGSEVLSSCNGRRTVEEIIDFFASRHRLTFHESRVSVTSYLKMLVQRGALAVVVNNEPEQS